MEIDPPPSALLLSIPAWMASADQYRAALPALAAAAEALEAAHAMGAVMGLRAVFDQIPHLARIELWPEQGTADLFKIDLLLSPSGDSLSESLPTARDVIWALFATRADAPRPPDAAQAALAADFPALTTSMATKLLDRAEQLVNGALSGVFAFAPRFGPLLIATSEALDKRGLPMALARGDSASRIARSLGFSDLAVRIEAFEIGDSAGPPTSSARRSGL